MLIASLRLQIDVRLAHSDPSFMRTQVAVSKGLKCTETKATYHTTDIYVPLYMSVLLMLAAIIWHYWNAVNMLLD